MTLSNNHLERIAEAYHLNPDIPDKFIETLCQDFCCEWLASLVTEHDSVLELGVGDGVTLERLYALPKRYCMVEGSKQLVDGVRNKYPDVEVVHSMFEDYSPARPFSKVLALHVLEHVDDPVGLLKHMRAWIAAGGELVVVVPNARSIHRQLAVMMGLQPALDTLSARDTMVGHQRVYDLETLRAHCTEAGFSVIQEKGFFLKTVPNSMMLAWQPDLISSLNAIGDRLPAGILANIALRLGA